MQLWGEARDAVPGRGRLDKVNGLNAWYKVTVLSLNSCGLREGGGRALAETLRLNNTVTSLDLGNNNNLRLRGNSLREGGGRALTETLRLNTTVTSLDLSENFLGEGGGRALAETLRLNTTVTSLHLCCNGLGEGGGRALTETLRLNTTLKLLNLLVNGLGEGAGRALAETLRLSTSVTSLNLSFNHMGEGGGRALAEALRANITLTSLNLGGNWLREGGGRALAETLGLNTTVTSLDLSDNGMGEEVRSVLRQAGVTGEGRWGFSFVSSQGQLHTHTHTHTHSTLWWLRSARSRRHATGVFDDNWTSFPNRIPNSEIRNVCPSTFAPATDPGRNIGQANFCTGTHASPRVYRRGRIHPLGRIGVSQSFATFRKMQSPEALERLQALACW
jgi:hypothetical protein